MTTPADLSSPRAAETLAASVPDEDRLDPLVWKICAVAMLGPLLTQLDATIVNASLSNLATDLKSSFTTIQWVTSGYLLALTFVLPLNGWLVSRIGAKALYLWCFSTFTLSSALCGFAWSADSLIAFRVLQGISGGLLAPMTQMMVAKAAGKHMARVSGFMTMPVLAAPILGPVVAGGILQYASWRWLFLVNLPVGAVALWMAARFLPDDREETTPRPLDWLGLLLLSPGLASLLYGVEHVGQSVGNALLATGLVMVGLFLWTARRKGDAALIDLRLFRNRVFALGTATMFVWNGVVFASQMLIPAFLIQGCGRTPAEMGWMLMPVGLGMLVTYPLMGWLTDRFGLRDLTLGGLVLTMVATLPMLWLADRGLSLAILLPALFLRGVGQGAVGLPTLTATYASVRRADLPMATTTLNTVQRLGGPTMTTLVASFLAWHLASQGSAPATLTAFGWSFLLLCGLQLITLLTVLGLPRRREDVAVED